MLCALSGVLLSCKTELESNEHIFDPDKGKGNIISFQTMQKSLGDKNISNEIKILDKFSLSKEEEITDFVIDKSKIIAIENSSTDIHYSMVLYPKLSKDKNVFYNLIIRKTHGKISKVIYKYTPDKDWFNDYNNKIYRMYKGKIDLVYNESIHSSNVLKSASCYEQYLEIPCEFGYYHDDAHCESSGSTKIKITICQDMGGSPTISYGSDNGYSEGSGSGGTPVTPQSLEEPMPNGNEYNNAYQTFKTSIRFSFEERQWLSLHNNESLNLFWYTYNMTDQNKAMTLAKKYIQLAIVGKNNFSYLPFSWVMNFIIENPTVYPEQFKDWFLTNSSKEVLQQIALENPATILKYESISSPSFKMRRIDQLKYPKFTTIIKNLKTEIQNNPTTLNRLVQLTGLTESQVLENLTFGQGPTIKLIPNLMGPSGPNYGNFDHSNPTYININLDFVLGLEQASLSTTRHATAFLLAITVLHEFIHFGNYISGYDTNGNEMGNLFEILTYGIIVTHLNAGNYIIQLK